MFPEPAHSFSPASLEKDLNTELVGRTVLVYDEVDSTNDSLKPIARDIQYQGLTVFARYQRKGRGRENRAWTASPGSSVLCSSLVFLPGRLADLAGPVSLAGAVATARAIETVFGLSVRIKWPNDVLWSGKKLAGMLVESTPVQPDLAGFIIGIGINVAQGPGDFPPKLRSTAGSIALGLGRKVSEPEFLHLARVLLMQLDAELRRVRDGNVEGLRHDWLDLAGGPDRAVIVNRQNQTFHARILDIDPKDNSLLAQDPEGMILHLYQNSSKIIGG